MLVRVGERFRKRFGDVAASSVIVAIDAGRTDHIPVLSTC
jgi:hypothetical protein